MNLFFLSKDPRKCGQYYCNNHLKYSIINATRMIAWAYYDDEGLPHITETALNSFPRKKGFFKWSRKYSQHPWALWIRESEENWVWAISLTISLCHEFQKLYKHHYGYEPILLWFLQNPPKFDSVRTEISLPPLSFENWNHFLVPTKPEITLKTFVKLYRYFYVLSKSELATWQGRREPKWWENYQSLCKRHIFDF